MSAILLLNNVIKDQDEDLTSHALMIGQVEYRCVSAPNSKSSYITKLKHIVGPTVCNNMAASAVAIFLGMSVRTVRLKRTVAFECVGIKQESVRPRWPYNMRPSVRAEKYIRDARRLTKRRYRWQR